MWTTDLDVVLVNTVKFNPYLSVRELRDELNDHGANVTISQVKSRCRLILRVVSDEWQSSNTGRKIIERLNELVEGGVKGKPYKSNTVISRPYYWTGVYPNRQRKRSQKPFSVGSNPTTPTKLERTKDQR